MSVQKQEPNKAILSDKQLARLSRQLYEQFKQKERTKKYAPVKEVLSLLGKGAVLVSSIMAPNTARWRKGLLYEEEDWDAWKRYNPSYLKRTIRRLEKQKQIEFIDTEDGKGIALTENGKQKIIKYAFEELEIKEPGSWNGRWWLVLYDLPKEHRGDRDFVRRSLLDLGFYKLQDSVYLYPYNCYDEIDYLRTLIGAGEHIRIVVVEHLEHDYLFREYFGLTV